MLKKVYRNELAVDMRFSAPVFFDDGENMLASKGIPLKKRELDVLDRWKIPFVLTAGEVLHGDPDSDIQDDLLQELEELEELDELDEIEEFIEPPEVKKKALSSKNKSPSIDASKINLTENTNLDELEFTSEQILKLPSVLENGELYKKYQFLIESLNTIFNDISEKNEIKTRSIDRIVSDLFSVIQSDRSGIVGFILGGEILEMDVAKSSVNTAILSIIIGEHLDLPRHRLLQIATGALLHDIGMLKIPESIVTKEGKLDEAETQTMRSHTFYGYKMIVNELMYADEVGKAAAQHHERWDGEGYPSRLAGENIDLGARIISVADAFEAMVSSKSWRNSMVGYQAMKNLLSDNEIGRAHV